MVARLRRDRHSATTAGLGAVERQIQTAFVQSFDLLAGPDVYLFSVPIERNSSPQNMAKLKAMGLRPGCPDVWIIWPSGGLALEFKKPKGGKVSDAQEATHKRLRRIGWPIEIVRSVDEAWEAVARHGCPVRSLLTGGEARRA